MPIMYVAMGLLAAGGLAALLTGGRFPRLAAHLGAFGGAAGALVALAGVALATDVSCLSRFFLLPTAILALAGAFYSNGYLRGHDEARSGIYWFFYNMTVAAMLFVPLATGKIAFLTAWELMGIASFALVAFEYRAASSQRAAWIYLIAGQAGAVALIVLFSAPAATAGWVLLVAALLGFGLKIGFPLLHGWLPEAHPAAPAPVSALMSGAMIHLGFYGLLHFCDLSGELRAVTGWVLLILGLVGALTGVVFALPASNLKRLLAYSSIENMGIVGIGFGLGLLGGEWGILGFAGAGLHIINHALLKGGLFLGAGAVYQATGGELELDRLGGLLKRMPFTGSLFIFNSFGVSGLPPFCGFASEFLIYMAAFLGVAHGSGALWTASLTTVVVLAVTGGVAAAVFAKAAGATFLGEPRSARAAGATEASRGMLSAMGGLFGLSLLLTGAGPWAVLVLTTVFAPLAGGEAAEFGGLAAGWMERLVLAMLIFMLLFVGLLVFRIRAWRKMPCESGVTWDCGYAAPTARMEYTASGFVQPLTSWLQGLLQIRRDGAAVTGYFPGPAQVKLTAVDFGERLVWAPIFRGVGKIADAVRHFQSGYLHFYLLVMVLALLTMLVWALVFFPEAGQ